MSRRLSPFAVPLAMTLTVGVSLFACKEEKGGLDDKPPPVVSNVEKNKKKDEKKPDETVPDFEKALKLEPTYDDKAGRVVVKVKVQEGYHAYAPGNEIGVAVDLNLDDKGGWKLDDKKIPAGKDKDLGELGKAKVLTGAFELSGAVKGGKGAITGGTKVQICTANVCDRPRTHAFELAGPSS